MCPTVQIVRTNSYARGLKRLRKLGASAADLAAMEAKIVAGPRAGDVIQGAGGLRKVRFAYAKAGKRGGGRTIYYYWDSADTLVFVTAYPKVDKDDLTADELKMFAALIRELADEQAED